MKFLKQQIKLYKTNDPSLKNTFEVFLCPGFKALIYYKISHFLYCHHCYFLARLISEHAKRRTGIEIHPGALIGNNLFIDHGTGIVIGETAIIKDNVTMYHGVTLGATKFTKQKRHPTIESNVLLGANATILGNITIGHDAKIGAGAIILKDIPPFKTVVGSKAHIVKK